MDANITNEKVCFLVILLVLFFPFGEVKTLYAL